MFAFWSDTQWYCLVDDYREKWTSKECNSFSGSECHKVLQFGATLAPALQTLCLVFVVDWMIIVPIEKERAGMKNEGRAGAERESVLDRVAGVLATCYIGPLHCYIQEVVNFYPEVELFLFPGVGLKLGGEKFGTGP